jgi:hypothetical protein
MEMKRNITGYNNPGIPMYKRLLKGTKDRAKQIHTSISSTIFLRSACWDRWDAVCRAWTILEGKNRTLRLKVSEVYKGYALIDIRVQPRYSWHPLCYTRHYARQKLAIC